MCKFSTISDCKFQTAEKEVVGGSRLKRKNYSYKLNEYQRIKSKNSNDFTLYD